VPAFVVGDQGPRAPEITMSFQWDSRPNRAGYEGHVYSTGGRAGQGQHGSMSRHELRNVMFSWGPSFKRRSTVLAPSGNTDLAPTVLRILGIADQVSMDGRVLEEALLGGPRVDRVDWSGEIYNAERRSGEQVYRQQIEVSLVGDTTYVDRGSSTLGRR
jgi:arylsulfatase A-like enzyme